MTARRFFQRRGLDLAVVAMVLVLIPSVLSAQGQPAKKDSPAFLFPKAVTLKAEAEPSQARPGETVTYRVTAMVDEPWHIYAYSKVQVDEGPRSTQLELFEDGGLKPLGDWTPAKEATKKPEPAFDNKVYGSYEGEASWSIQLQVPADAEAGESKLQSQIYFQICDPTKCNPPVYKSLEPVVLTIAGEPVVAAAGLSPSPVNVEAGDEGATKGGSPAKKDSPAFLFPKAVTLKAEVEPSQARPGETVTYRVTAMVDEPWHIYAYSKVQVDEGPRSTQLELFEDGGLKPLGDWTPAKEATKKPEPAFDNKVYGSYEGEASWSIQLQVPADAEAGESKLQSQIYFQICDPTKCNPPVYKSLEPVVLTIAGEPVVAAAGLSPSPVNVEAGDEGATKGEKLAASATSVEASSSTPSPASQNIAEQKISEGLIPFLLFAALGGLAALVMPCVWPMVPVTVNFFVKQGQSKNSNGTRLAITYCLAIIAIFTLVGVLFSAFMGAASLQRLANTAWLNLLVAFIFLAFGLSLLGLFEIRLPNSLLNASAQGEGRGGLVGVFFMALTLTITSFTCTFPVVGGLLVVASRGSYLYPVLGLATFATVLALPFFLLALAPGLLKRVPRSGDWMNAVKVVGGLVEIGAAFKFLNTAEIALGATPDTAWFDVQVVLSVWVVLAVVAGLYLLGMFRTDHDHDSVGVGPVRILSGAGFFFLALYFAPALFGFPPQSKLYNLFVGLMPPDVGELSPPIYVAGAGGEGLAEIKATSKDPAQAEREEKISHGVQWGMSYDQAIEESRESGKPVLVDFTGVNCANCRQMEREVMPRPEIRDLMGQFVTVAQYTDFVPIGSITPAEREQLARANSLRQYEMVSDVTTPLYVVVAPDGRVVGSRGGYIPAAEFKAFLEEQLSRVSQETKVVGKN